jgi:hypothetical protein
MATARHKSPTTELYFVNAVHIQQPQRAQGGQSLALVFAIRDLEGHDAAYIYRVSFTDSRGTTTLGEGRVALADQQIHIVNQSVVASAGISQGLVQVTLVGRNETINYWLERTV